MNLSEPFIRRPIMTTLVMLTLLAAGFLAYFELPVSNLPDVDFPVIQVTAVLPGASPETMAKSVATPLEREFMTIGGLSNVTSTNTLGNTNIILQFDITKNLDSAAQDVTAAIARAERFLPPNLLSPPTYRKLNPADTPILYLALTSETMTSGQLYTYAQAFLGQRLAMVSGVAQVQAFGSPYAVRVQVNPRKIANLGITLQEVADAISKGNPLLATGILDGTARASTIVTDGTLDNAEGYNPLIITYKNGAPVRIRDVGKAIDSVSNLRTHSLFVEDDHSEPTVVLAIQRQPGANTVQVAEAIEQILPKLKEQLPASIKLKIIFDRSQTIRSSINEVKITLLIAFILVVLVIFFYLGHVRDTIIPSLALPISIVGTFIVMYFLGYSIDNLSLLAFILAIGFIVDDAIVVLENIVRHVELGESPLQAALGGSRQICFTIISMTLSLMAIFIPLLFMPGLIGNLFKEFAVTLATVTFLSGIVSLTLTPMLCSRFLPPRETTHSSAVADFSGKFNRYLISRYKPSLEWVLQHRSLALGVGTLSVILSIVFFVVLPKDFIPDDDIGFIFGFVQSQEGTSSDRMLEYQKNVNKVIRENPAVENFVSITAMSKINESLVFIRLKPRSERHSSIKIIQELQTSLGQIPGVNIFLRNVPLIDLNLGSTSKGTYQYTLQSMETDLLYRTADILTEKVKKLPGFQAVTSDLELKNPQLDVQIRRDEASAYGITAEQIEKILGYAYAGGRVSQIQTSLEQYDVILEVDDKDRANAASLPFIYVKSANSNDLVPLGAVANWKEGIGPTSINHLSQFPAVTISFNLAPGVSLGTALKSLDRLAANILPDEVTGGAQGSAQTFQKSVTSIAILLVLAILAIYVVLGILYESFIHPLTILSTLPPAMVGGLLTLWIFNVPLSLYAFLGIILLLGIVKKNGIMVVDYALDYQRQKGESPEHAVVDACMVRFRPIMMTTAAAIFGALPIVFGAGAGADARRPLGLVIIGGLLVSQLVTLFLTPVIYLYFEKKYPSTPNVEAKTPL